MIRLTLVCNASTAATRQGAFPADEPLDARGLKEATDSAKALKPTGRALVSPALRAMQTAEALGLSATPDDDLRDIDYGRWSGFSLTDIASREAGGGGHVARRPRGGAARRRVDRGACSCGSGGSWRRGWTKKATWWR
ncbi:MAG: phosphoglycerate mutase family protein [Bauldia sp.]